MAKQVDGEKQQPQFLQVPKELDEDSWISGEELFTDGSSDEERGKKTGRKPKRSLGALRKSSQINNSMAKEPPPPGPGPALELEAEWRPKRGSLKLPDLFSAFDPSGLNFADFENLDFGEPILPVNVQEYFQDKDRLEMLCTMRENIHELDKKLTEADQKLEEEHKERLKAQDQINSDYATQDLDEFMFENITNSFIDERQPNKTDDNETNKQETNTNLSKKFIKRNIELAAKAMNKLPLTDEEKQKLDEILAEEVDEKEQEATDKDAMNVLLEKVEDNREESHSNAYKISEEEQRRIDFINSKLEEFGTADSNEEAELKTDRETYWRTHVLEQAMKNVDAKLEQLKEKDAKTVV